MRGARGRPLSDDNRQAIRAAVQRIKDTGQDQYTERMYSRRITERTCSPYCTSRSKFLPEPITLQGY